jgi:hypothetical protein
MMPIVSVVNEMDASTLQTAGSSHGDGADQHMHAAGQTEDVLVLAEAANHVYVTTCLRPGCFRMARPLELLVRRWTPPLLLQRHQLPAQHAWGSWTWDGRCVLPPLGSLHRHYLPRMVAIRRRPLS